MVCYYKGSNKIIINGFDDEKIVIASYKSSLEYFKLDNIYEVKPNKKLLIKIKIDTMDQAN